MPPFPLPTAPCSVTSPAPPTTRRLSLSWRSRIGLIRGAACLVILLSGAPARSEEPSEATDIPRTGTTTSADGVEIAYTVREPAGGSDAAAPLDLVFVHGWACDQGFWREQVEAFSSYRIVTLDLAGHGLSGTDREEWSLEAFGPDIAAVVTALDLRRVVLIGHSMGGPATLLAAPLIADRLVGIVGVDTFHDADFQVPAEQWQGFVDAYRQDFEGTCQQAVTAMVGKAGDPLRSWTIREMCDAPRDVAIALMDRFGAFRSGPAMAEVKVPIRAINAGGGMPTRVEINRKYSPGFDAIQIPDVGHFLMLEVPETFNGHLRAVLDELALRRSR